MEFFENYNILKLFQCISFKCGCIDRFCSEALAFQDFRVPDELFLRGERMEGGSGG